MHYFGGLLFVRRQALCQVPGCEPQPLPGALLLQCVRELPPVPHLAAAPHSRCAVPPLLTQHSCSSAPYLP